jgi:acetyltransferase-like isoleucine patch superfamily enzyme
MGGSIELGRYTEIHRGALIWAYGGRVILGEHCTVNPYTIIYGHGNVTIGDNVRIAAQVVIIPANHQIFRNEPIFRQSVAGKGIKIGNDVWIGAGSRILDGVTIQTGCVVGAGSVVTKSTEPYGIYVGVPARRIGERKDPETLHSKTAITKNLSLV